MITTEISQAVKLQRELLKVTMRVCSEELVQGVVAGLGEGPALEKLTIEGQDDRPIVCVHCSVGSACTYHVRTLTPTCVLCMFSETPTTSIMRSPQ